MASRLPSWNFFSLDFIRILLDHRRHSSSTNSKMIRNPTWLLGRHLRSIFQIYNTRNIEAIDLNFAQIIINVILIQISVQLKSKTADKDFSFLIISLRNIGAIDFIRCSWSTHFRSMEKPIWQQDNHLRFSFCSFYREYFEQFMSHFAHPSINQQS